MKESDLLKMSYSQVAEIGKEYYVPLVRLKELLEEKKEIKEECSKWYEILFQGELKGYTIKCPNCGIRYPIDTNINREKIQCQDCGFNYLQTENIAQIRHTN